MRRRNTGSGSVYKRGRLWWIAWTENGGRRKESSGSTVKAEAQAALHRKLAARAAGARASKGIPLTIEELTQLVIADYTANGRRSTGRAQTSAGHLVRVLGELLGAEEKSPASAVDEATITAYIAHRQVENAAAATINRELACLRRGLRLAVRSHRLERRPDFEMLTENNARKGFLEEAQFRSILPHLDEDVRPAVVVAYWTGWRMRSEILTRERRHLDLKAGWLRIEPGETKNNKGRMFPLNIPQLREVLKAQVAKTEKLERGQGQLIPWLFHRNGVRVADFRAEWKNACTAAGLPGKLLHDFRRTAVRNMERRHVPRSAAMQLVGHETESIYKRYAIVDEAMLEEAGRLLAQAPAANVVQRRNNRSKKNVS